jgi:membrane protein
MGRGKQKQGGIKIWFKDTIARLKSRYQPAYERWLAKPGIQLIVRIVNRIGSDNVTSLAGSLSYTIILSLFPLLFGALAIFGYFFNTETLQSKMTEFIQQYVPSAADILTQNLDGVTRVRAVLGIVGVLGLLWTGIAIFTRLDNAVNQIWGVKQPRSFFPAKGMEILVAVICVILFLLSLGLSIGLEYLSKANIAYSGFFVQAGGYIISFMFIFLMFVAIYKLFPNTRVKWQEVWPGALLAAFLFVLARQLFLYFAVNVSRYQLIYGSLAAFVIFLIWIYYSTLILMISAIFSVELYRLRWERREGTSRVVKIGQNQS